MWMGFSKRLDWKILLARDIGDRFNETSSWRVEEMLFIIMNIARGDKNEF